MVPRRDFLIGAGLAPLFPVSAQAAQALRPHPGGIQRLTLEGRYLPRWLELTRDEAEARRMFAAQMPGFSDWELDLVVADAKEQFAAFLGDEMTALRSAAAEAISPPLGAFSDAIMTIKRAAVGRRVVILNESHAASRHRAFLEHLLRALSGEGFTHLAAETFSDEALPRLPLQSVGARHGYYLRDPVFAEAVRVALTLRYRLAAYEQPAHMRVSDGLTSEAARSREDAQAANLARILQDDPAARILVYVGYGHLREDRESTMAARFQALTGLDPLTIEQARTGSFGPDYPDAWRPAEETSSLHYAVAGSSISPRYADLSVYHRSLPPSDGRPGWLAALPERTAVRINLPRLPDGPALAQAVHAGDKEPCVPADQFQITPGRQQVTFFLRPGAYRFRIEREDGFQDRQAFEIPGVG